MRARNVVLNCKCSRAAFCCRRETAKTENGVRRNGCARGSISQQQYAGGPVCSVSAFCGCSCRGSVIAYSYRIPGIKFNA